MRTNEMTTYQIRNFIKLLITKHTLLLHYISNIKKLFKFVYLIIVCIEKISYCFPTYLHFFICFRNSLNTKPNLFYFTFYLFVITFHLVTFINSTIFHQQCAKLFH